ncbi:hypothetical protein D3C71_1585310 [compost metagenome]
MYCPSLFETLFVTPPNIGVHETLTLTFEGTKISIPPNIEVALIITSLSIIAFFRLRFTPPNIESIDAPLNSSTG